jgi:hypothetical protein
MQLGDYYDEVMKEAGLSETVDNSDAVEEIKVAEVVEELEKEGAAFETEEAAAETISQIIEDDYAEKVANVCNEFDIDEIEFDNEEEKVAAAMEVVDGWESLVVANAVQE